MPFVDVRDLRVYYEITGSPGPGEAPRARVLLISGTGADLRVARSGAPQSPLAERFEVLEYDQRGLGQTSKPDVDYTMADYADDAAALLDALGWGRVHVVGVSFGGMVAQHLAIRHPHRVDRLVLACTSPGGAGGSSYDLLLHEQLDADERPKAAMRILDSRNDLSADPPVFAPGFERLAPVLAAWSSGGAGDPDSAMGARRQLLARRDHDAWDALPGVGAPTLCIGGRYDLQAPVENMQNLAARLPDARLVLCDGGHLFLMQDPSAWPAIVEFLAG